jgi:hypothetical protein
MPAPVVRHLSRLLPLVFAAGALLRPSALTAQPITSEVVTTRTYEGCDIYFCQSLDFSLLKTSEPLYQYYARVQVRTQVLAALFTTSAQSFTLTRISLDPLGASTDDLQYLDYRIQSLVGARAGDVFERGLMLGSNALGGGANYPFAPTRVSAWGLSNTGPGLGSTVVSSSTTLVVTPEPSTWALLGTGLLAVGGLARRKRTASV